MNVFKLQLLLFVYILYVSDSERRIQGGDEVVSQKAYMVYLVKAPKSVKKYDQWLCGGALVTTWFVLTAQGCVLDVEYMYVIAGYNKYVTDDQIESDPCTRDKKKKVVYFCVPEASDFSVDTVAGWAAQDIALAKVETEYDLNDDSFRVSCSYTPTVIPINYELRFQEQGTDAIILGWGHTNDWRMPFDQANYNQKLLYYARIKLMASKLCKDHFPILADVIEKYNMVCSLEGGEIDETGKLNLTSSSPKLDGCKAGLRTQDCSEELKHSVPDEEIVLSSLLNLDETVNDSTNVLRVKTSSGFCQNDHGGPLVTWVGSKEVLIGLATLFKVSDHSKCEGPYLFTSTACYGAFLHCVLTNDSATRRRMCDSRPIERGYKIMERYISWADHPAGPSENETLSAVKYAGDTQNNQTNTTKGSNAFEELMKLETFWKQYNSNTNESTTVAREN